MSIRDRLVRGMAHQPDDAFRCEVAKFRAVAGVTLRDLARAARLPYYVVTHGLLGPHRLSPRYMHALADAMLELVERAA